MLIVQDNHIQRTKMMNSHVTVIMGPTHTTVLDSSRTCVWRTIKILAFTTGLTYWALDHVPESLEIYKDQSLSSAIISSGVRLLSTLFYLVFMRFFGLCKTAYLASSILLTGSCLQLIILFANELESYPIWVFVSRVMLITIHGFLYVSFIEVLRSWLPKLEAINELSRIIIALYLGSAFPGWYELHARASPSPPIDRWLAVIIWIWSIVSFVSVLIAMRKDRPEHYPSSTSVESEPVRQMSILKCLKLVS